MKTLPSLSRRKILFEGGFNVLTGETGAGKPIVIDAISAILGERTYRDVIRTGANRAFVSAIFTNIPQYDWFSENQVEFDTQELQVQREIYADGRNVCRVNGRRSAWHRSKSSAADSSTSTDSTTRSSCLTKKTI